MVVPRRAAVKEWRLRSQSDSRGRATALGYDQGWLEHYGGFRAGCFINSLPAMGLVLVPDDTTTSFNAENGAHSAGV